MPTILITGAASGIGAGIAKRLIRDGANVIIADKQPANIPGARAEICDVADESSVNVLMANIEASEGRLDGLVCNAGLMIRKPIAELTLAEWSAVLATNLTSIFLLAKAAENLLRAARGSILTIASTRAHMSEPNTESYAASKGGIVALTHALAISLGPDVRANVISPGWINTQSAPLSPQDHAQHPAGRVGTVEDVAGLAAYLLGPEAGFCSGAEFVIDGGMTRKMIYAE
jgi:NAD(P)-dependent dehydrogenase (short-subunit alcohol dehydrogenase family)